MKIDDRKALLDPQLGGVDGLRPDGRAKAGPTAPAGDRVSVSDTARELAALRGAVGDLDTVRPERVAVLQAAVDAGRYVPDVEGTARALLRETIGDALG